MRFAAVFVVLLLAGCASGGASSASVSPSESSGPLPAELLPGDEWVLFSSAAVPGAPQFGVTMQFDEGKVAGKAPVNRYFGTAAVGEGSLTFGPLATTQMAGPPEAMTAETGYMKALAGVTQWQVAGEVLSLSDAQGTLLQFGAPDSTGAFAATLLGKPRGQAKAAAQQAGYEWRVVSVDGESLAVTDDYRPQRIDASIQDGVVTAVSVG